MAILGASWANDPRASWSILAPPKRPRPQDLKQLRPHGHLGTIWGHQMAPTWPKVATRWPKTAPRWPKTVPRRSQDGPRWPQDGTRMAQDGPKLAPRWAKMGQHGPRWPQNRPHCSYALSHGAAVFAKRLESAAPCFCVVKHGCRACKIPFSMSSYTHPRSYTCLQSTNPPLYIPPPRARTL